MNIYPTADHIVVLRAKADSKTPGGILIPDSAKERLNRGTVLAVGPGRFQDGKLIEPRLSKGDKVLFSNEIVDDVVLDGQELTILCEGSVIAVLGD